MTVGFIDTNILSDTADAIREQTGESGTIKPTMFASKVRSLQAGTGSSGPVTDDKVTLTTTEDALTLKQENAVQIAKARIQSKYKGAVNDQILRASGINSSANVINIRPSLLAQGDSDDAVEIAQPTTPERIVINSVVAPTERSYPGCRGLNAVYAYNRDSADNTYPGGPDVDMLSFADIAIRVDTPDSLWMNYEGLLAFYSLNPDSPYSIWEDTPEVREYIAALKENGYMDIKDTRAYAIRSEVPSAEKNFDSEAVSVMVDPDHPDMQFQNELIFGETCLYVEEVKGIELAGRKKGDVIPVPGLLSRTVVDEDTEEETTEVYFRPYFTNDYYDAFSAIIIKDFYEDYFTVDVENETITLIRDANTFNVGTLWLYAAKQKTYKVALPPWCPSFPFKHIASLATRRVSGWKNDEYDSSDALVELNRGDLGVHNIAVQVFAEIALANGLLDCHYIPVGYCSVTNYRDLEFDGSYENILRYSYVLDDHDMGRSANIANNSAINALENMLLDSESRSMSYEDSLELANKYPYAEIEKTYSAVASPINLLKSANEVYSSLVASELTTQNGVTIERDISGDYLKIRGQATAAITIPFGENIKLLPHHRYIFSNFSATTPAFEDTYISCELTGDTSQLTISQYVYGSPLASSAGTRLVVNNTDNEISIGARVVIKTNKSMSSYKIAPRLLDLTLMFGENCENEVEQITALVSYGYKFDYLTTSYRQDNIISIRAREVPYEGHEDWEYPGAESANFESAALPVPMAIRKLPGYGMSFMGARNYVDWEKGIYHQSVGVAKINVKNNKANDVVALINSIPDSYCLVTPFKYEEGVSDWSALLVKINHGYTDGFNYDPTSEYWNPEEEESGEESAEFGTSGYEDTENDMYAKMQDRGEYLDPALTPFINYKPNASITLPVDIPVETCVYVIYKLATPIDIDVSQYIKTNRLKLNDFLYVDTERMNGTKGFFWLQDYYPRGSNSQKMVEYKVKTPKS